jgi:FAD:protein FMN transferase
MQSYPPPVERTKALLGTFVSVRVQGLERGVADALLDRCFAEMHEIHALMSFQEHGSDVSRLNRDAHRHPVRVDPRTVEVLRLASAISRQSGGAFDVTVAPQVVQANASPAPIDAPAPDPDARWTDLVLLPDRLVRHLRPLWIDLSGIAKGYAVDRVIEILSAAAPSHASVNAGGDLRVIGAQPEWVRLGVDLEVDRTVPMVALHNESLASSGRRPAWNDGGACSVAHIDGARRRLAPGRFVSVLASTCVVADALTKVVMARGADAAATLRHFEARALMSEGPHDWREVA